MREFSNFRVLIIDGDVDFALSLSNRLEIQKFTVETAVDAAGASAALERFEADAALIDLRLGGGVSPSGLDLIADLRRRRPAIICVMVTAFAELETVLEAWRAGADDLLIRPIDPPELFAVLERCIAKRKRLRGSEQRFRDFSDATSDWFWEMDENLRFSYFSDRFSDVTGVPRDSLLGKTREETGVPDIDPEVWEAHLADLAAHRSFRDFQHWRTLADGRQVYLSINGKAIFDEAGAFLGYRGAGRDITVRKRAEDALRQAHYELEQRVEERTTELLAANTRLVQEIAERNRAEAELRESEAHYREIFDESPVGIWESDWSAVKRFIDHLADHGVTDWRGFFTENPERLGQAYNLIRLVDVSRAVLKLYGVADVTTLAKIYRADTVPQDNLDGFREALLSLIEGPMTSHYEARERRADGAEIITRNTLAVPVNHFDDWSRVIYSVEDITERKHAGESLRKSEARYREIFDESPVGIWEDDWSDVKRMLDSFVVGGVTDLREYFHDNPGKLLEAYDLSKSVDISHATIEMFGAPNKQALMDWTQADLEPDEEIDGFLGSIIAFMAGETSFEFESPCYGYEGEPIVTSNRLVIPPQHRHDWSRVIYAIEDITKRKQAEKALRESDDRYALAVAGTNDGIWDWNIQTGENYFSPRWKAILGYGEDELTHHVDTFFDHVHPDDRALVDEANRAHFEKRKPNDLEFRMRHKDGHYVWVRERGQAVWDSDGKPLRMAGSLSDITERRAAEEAIRTRDAWLRGIMENAPMEIVLKDTDGKIMAISRNVAAEVGRPREDYIGRTTADFLPAKIAEIYMKADREVVESGRLVQQEVVEENPDGSPRHMLNAKFPLKDDKGKIIGICSLTTDVTEMKEVQAQLHQAQKMEAVGQLTGGIAHDFNNLLAIVMGNIELIQDEIDGDGALGGYLKAAFSAVDDAATLTQSLLAFSRNQPLMPKVADMNTLVRKMIGLVGRTLGDAIIIKTSFADDLAPVSIDSGQLQNALLNLVVNARDAMPNGGEIYIETGSLTVGGEGGESDPLAGPGDYVSLTVRDTGEGMPRDVLEHVFEPFFTTKEVGEGSGLGLSMVFGFVKQSGGHVTIHSEVGRGATVTLCLPTTTEAISDEKKPIRDLDARGGGETILFVEDDERVLHIIVDQLTGMGYEVHHARDGGAALDIVDRIPAIDLLLTDVKLPGGMNGAELALEMRRRLPSLPVLYASGHSAAELKKAGHLKDNADLIEKPFTRRELAAKVAAMLS